MYLGKIVEIGPAAEIFAAPAHPYTQALLSAIPKPVPGKRRDRVILDGELPDPANPPAGCAFHTRCRYAMERCATERPALVVRRTEGGTRENACHLMEPVEPRASAA
jgi:oligopeptide/dipeptide ABC transporter ATP-binding protein